MKEFFLLRDRRLLLYLFISFRLMMLIVYQPYLIEGVERGLTVFGDFQHYYNLAELADQNLLPYRDYWYEFPPVFPVISLTAHTLIGAQGDFTAYATLLNIIMIIFDVGNLLLLMRLGNARHGEVTGTSLGWIYAVLVVPLIFSAWTFEPIVCFALLLTLNLLVGKRDTFAAPVTALGALTKLYPLIMLAAVWRFRPPIDAIRVTLITIIITVLGIGAMLAFAGEFGMPSLTAQFNKASYQTVWALLDGNYRTGNFGPIADHFEPEKAYQLFGNPARFSTWLRSAIFALIGLFIYSRVRRFDVRGLVAFATITITVFFLWSQGWSPQWLMVLLPLILLNFPTRNGVLICLMLSLSSFIEYPVLFARTAETNGAISGTQLTLYAALIVLRTLILCGLTYGLYRLLRLERGTEPA